MAAVAQNLRRLAKLLVRPPPVTEACFAHKWCRRTRGEGGQPCGRLI
jgi:hypothetical protein